MLCEKCGQNEATVKLVQIENNKRTELHLCQKCAQGYTSFTIGFDLQNLLSSMFQMGTPAQKQCPTCGRTIADIQKTGRLGCGTCHDTFKEELSPVLRKLQGSTTHTGKVPARSHPKVRASRDILDLRRRLEESVRQENYEQAAKYRDEIRSLERQLTEGGREHERD